MGLATEFANHLRERPTNAVLAVLAMCVLADVFFAGVGASFTFTMGLFGALVLRAFSEDVQPIALTLVGIVLSGIVITLNHHIIEWDSDWRYVVALLIAFLYAFWEKIVNWFSL